MLWNFVPLSMRSTSSYVPYLCFQEAKHLIGRSLPRQRFQDLLDFHGFASSQGPVAWSFEEVKKLLDAAAGEISRTKAVYQQELASFASAIGDGLLHGTREVFDLLETLNLDVEYNDKLVLASLLVKAKALHQLGERELFFMTTDKKHLQPTAQNPELTRYYQEAGVTFVSGFSFPGPPDNVA